MILLSVALVTRNRPESLNRCLQSLRAQNMQPFEVVIADDSDPDRAHETRTIADRWDCRYITGPRQGLYANRNHVALACQGTYIRTMDDDHLFPVGHFQQCFEAIQADPASIWTTGEVGLIKGEVCWRAPTANQLVSSGVGGPVQNLDDNWAIADGSTIYPREVFDRGYRMVDAFNYGSSYLEFGAYLYRQGFKSRCIRGAIVEHYPEDNSLLQRDETKPAILTHIFASLCYNKYFMPNSRLAWWHLLSKMRRYGLSISNLSQVMEVQNLAKHRWCPSEAAELLQK
jgi:glycosyltransferase involved in cell wall biosynthesis